MSNSLELQDEEREVLSSIYDGDEAYKQITPTTHQYKYGTNNESKSFVLEIKWGDSYPDEKPQINMDTFYNKHLVQNIKDKVSSLLLEEAEQYLGMSMTYSLFEFLKEKFDEVITIQPDQITAQSMIEEDVAKISLNENSSNVNITAKKEQLTKAQKRRQWDKVDSRGEKARGWNWVDIVKHLSQTGNSSSQSVKKDESALVNN